MANLAQVGLEFVTKGEKALAESLLRVDNRQNKLLKTSKALDDAFKRNANIQKSLIAVRRQMTTVSRLNAQRQREEAAALRESQPAMEAYNRSLLGIDESFKSARASMDVFKQVLGAIEQDTKMADAAAQEYNNTLLGINTATKSARASMDVFKQSIDAQVVATRQEAAAAAKANAEREQAAQSYRQLKAAIDPAYAAQMRMKKAHDAVRQALANGVITRQEAADSLRQYRAQAQMNSAEMTRLSGVNHIASRQTNAYGMATQQVGYQVGDFIVQVQSGTNAFVAFGQQATQLVGILPMMAGQFGLSTGRLIAISAGLGIVIPLVTALGAALVRTEGGGKVFEELAFAIEPIRPLLEALQAAMSAAANTTVNFINVIVNNLDRLIVAATVVTGLFAAKWVATFIKAGKVTAALTAGLGLLRKAMLRLPFVAIAAAATEVVFQFLRIVKLTGSVGEAFSLIGKIASEVFKFESLKNGVLMLNAKVSEIVLSMTATFMQFGVDIVSFIGGPFNKIGAVVMGAVEGIKSVFGVIPAFIENVGLSAANFFIGGMEKLANGAIESVNKVIEAFNKLLEWMGADRFAELFGFTGQVGTIDPIEIDRFELSDKAKEAGEAFSEGFARGYDESLVQTPVVDTLQRIVDETRSTSEAMGALADAYGQSFMDANPALESLIKRLREANATGMDIDVRDWFKGLGNQKDSDSGSSAETERQITQEQFLRQLEQEIAQKRRLAGMTEQQRAIEERVIQLSDEAAQKGLNISAARLRQFAMEEQRIQQQMQLQETFSRNIESALMSVVDGTKSVEDAFRGMLRNIILEIYKQQVAQPFAEQAGNFLSNLFFAKGGVFQNGNVTAYANGGVVNGPTYFPMKGSNVGLMGEAGPEAIMPLKRTKGGKLGVVAEGSGGVTVVQNFNISANGDESVKRIVRGEAPRIAEQAKAAVVDAKRRGGSYGRAFG